MEELSGLKDKQAELLGQWERALNQLTVAAELDALAVPMKQVYGDAVRCEYRSL